MGYDIWYMRPDHFREGTFGAKPDPRKLEATHIFLKTIEATDLDTVYHDMQGEVWSPHGEARSLIRARGLRHTSMSIGDVAVERSSLKVYLVASIGFEELGTLRPVIRAERLSPNHVIEKDPTTDAEA